MSETSPGRWLFKCEPDCYSYSDLERDGSTLWDGVENNAALKNLRSVQPGDRVLYYQTGKDKAIVGEMTVTKGPMPDPAQDDEKLVVVEVEPVKRWPRPVTLAEIKKEASLVSWDLVRISRLSVMRVSADQWKLLEKMAERPK